MTSQNCRRFRLIPILLFPLLLAACAAGDAQFTEQSRAGFFYGLWHGIISVITLIIHIFNDNIHVYEINNTGGWYDFGFLAGVIMVWGGGCHAKHKSNAQKKRDKEWDEVGNKVEKKIMRKMKEWAEDEQAGGKGQEWDEIGEKIEKKIKRKLREWAEKE